MNKGREGESKERKEKGRRERRKEEGKEEGRRERRRKDEGKSSSPRFGGGGYHWGGPSVPGPGTCMPLIVDLLVREEFFQQWWLYGLASEVIPWDISMLPWAGCDSGAHVADSF